MMRCGEDIAGEVTTGGSLGGEDGTRDYRHRMAVDVVQPPLIDDRFWIVVGKPGVDLAVGVVALALQGAGRRGARKLRRLKLGLRTED